MALNVHGSSSMYWKTGIDNTNMKAGVIQAKGLIAGLASSVTRQDVFLGLGASAGLAFLKMTQEATVFSRAFDKAMKEVSTISVAVQKDFEEISKSILDMSKAVPVGGIDLARAYYQILSSGVTDTARALEILNVSSRLATAGLTTTEIAAESVVRVLNAYGEAAGDAQKVSDTLFKIVSLGMTRMENLGPEMSKITLLSSQAGVSFNDLTAAIATTTQVLGVEQTFTGLRAFLGMVITPADEALQVAKALNFEFSIAALKSKGLLAFVQELMAVTGGDIEILSKIFPDKRSISGMLALTRENGKAFIDVQKQFLGDLASENKKAFEIMNDTTGAQLTRMQNNILNALKPMGGEISSWIKGMAKEVNNLFETFGDASEKVLDRKKVFDILYRPTTAGYGLYEASHMTEKAWQEKQIRNLGYSLPSTFQNDLVKLGSGNRVENISNLTSTIINRDANVKREADKYAAGLTRDIVAQTPVKRTPKAPSLDELNAITASDDLNEKQLAQQKKDADEYAKLYSEMLKEIEVFEGKKIAIMEHYAKLQQVAGNEDQERKLARNEQNALDALEKERVYEEDFAKDAAEASKEIRADESKQELDDRIIVLRKLEEQYKDHDKALSDIKTMRVDVDAELASRYTEENKVELDKLLKDTRDYSAAKLRDYIATIQKAADAAKASGNTGLATVLYGVAKDETTTVLAKEKDQVKELAAAFTDLGQVVGEYDAELGKTLNTLGDMLKSVSSIGQNIDNWKSMGDSATGLEKLTSGIGIIGSGLSILSTGMALVDGISNIFSEKDKTIENITIQLKLLRIETDKYTEARRRASGEMIPTAVRASYEDARNRIQKDLQSLRNLEIVNLTSDKYSKLGDIFKIDEKSYQYLSTISKTFGSTDPNNPYRYNQFILSDAQITVIKELVGDIEDADKAMFDLQEQYKEIITGTTKETIAGSISEGFANGLKSVSDFADTFKSIMRKAILDSFHARIVTNYMNRWYDDFAAKMDSEGGLSGDEIADLQNNFNSIIQATDLMLSDIEKATGINLRTSTSEVSTGTPAGISGAIQGITENTAGLLEGQFNAMRVNTFDLLEVAREIEAKTGTGEITQMLAELYSVNQKLFDSNSTEKFWLNNIGTGVQNALAQLVNINDGKLLPMLNGVSEIAGQSYYLDDIYSTLKTNLESALLYQAYLPDIYAKTDDILTAANRTADVSEKYLPYMKKISERLELNAVTNYRAMGG